jgi:hypothetical protein
MLRALPDGFAFDGYFSNDGHDRIRDMCSSSEQHKNRLLKVPEWWIFSGLLRSSLPAIFTREVHASGSLSAAAAVTTLKMISITSSGDLPVAFKNENQQQQTDHSHNTKANPLTSGHQIIKMQIKTMASCIQSIGKILKP